MIVPPPSPPPSSASAPPIPRAWRLRLWPGLVIVALINILAVVPGMLWPLSMVHFACLAVGLVLGPVAITLWWLLAARVRGWDRWLFPLLLFLPTILLGATLLRHSLMCLLLYPWPLAAVLWVLWLACTVKLPHAFRRRALIALLLAFWTLTALVRFDGISASGMPNMRWCWHPTAEAEFLRQKSVCVRGLRSAPPVTVTPADWPEFRGPNRDARLTGISLNPDWAAHPPTLLWKRRVGPGWGSFAAASGRLFTQEQRGAEEAVVCYSQDTGDELWAWSHTARFNDESSGSGPRATPTLDSGNLFAQGATGLLVCLDAATGNLRWSTDVQAATNAIRPQWGYSSSPLVIAGNVIVFAGGKNNRGTAAFNAQTGQLVWANGHAGHSYSSAHRATLAGVEQVLMISEYGIESFEPAAGTLLWDHHWPTQVDRVVQPVLLNDSDLLVGSGTGAEQGTRRLHITRDHGTWTVQTLWTERNLRPYFNDGVALDSSFFGFDDAKLCCLDLSTGTRLWSSSAYGHGQVLLLADQSLLFVQSVDGSIALLRASPAAATELARLPALDGKTWNHPVIANHKLFLRNAQEAACFELPR
jgi:outer membrane protein assembly factor BamB